ncbi:methyltransferase domain-containing protein [Paraburkholderia sp. Ac-20340]|uniref:methyltransferase domain-containing protein n=1 Tax=Paraburkholderia sp. Ac-20340 TaxID=2703888 RepID=UPI00197F6422|nr:class I SAM-dependent methyltransferase [Paraburkholderia sp. Ac-20340]MBN3858839.1 methyltransferase domain-containing protein [Paraburkholderia sp. Ac-20340]
MHLTALKNAREFFDCYAPHIVSPDTQASIIEIGSQDVNGSLRSVCPQGVSYTGVDFVEGRGVDVVLQDPYVLPFGDASADVVLASSVFEHSEMFWVLFLEIMRVLKPTGLFYLNVPSNGDFHRWPVDCWRFYPDSGNALVTWAKRNGMQPLLLESYTSLQQTGLWNDFVAVFLKDQQFAERYPTRILHNKYDYLNGIASFEPARFHNQSTLTEDRLKLQAAGQGFAEE